MANRWIRGGGAFRGGTNCDHVASDITDTTSPALRRLVQDVVDSDTGILLGQRVKVLLQQDILRADVGKDEIDLGLVAQRTTADNGTDDLEHRGDARPASNHAKVTNHVGGVNEGALGSADANSLADHEGGHVLRDVALGVGLDEEVEVARLVVTGYGGVRADNLLGGAIGLGKGRADRDVLADGEAEDGVGGGKLEAVAAREAVMVSARIQEHAGLLSQLVGQ